MPERQDGGPADDARGSHAPAAVSARKYKALLVLCGVLFVALVAVTASLVTALRLDTPTVLAGGATSPGSSPTTDVSPDRSPEQADEPEPEPTQDESVMPTIEPDPGASDDRVDPAAEFTEAYSGQRLRVTDECSGRLLDLDEPRVGVESLGYEVQYQFCSGKSELGFSSGTSVSRGGVEDAGPGDCVEAIRVGVDPSRFAPTQQEHLCVITSADTAQEQGITQKVVLLSVLGIAQDGTLTVEATAWNIPT